MTKYDTIVVIAGKEYVDIVREVFSEKKIITPLKEVRGMGAMISIIKRAIVKE